MLVNHFLENSAARLPDKVALICGDQRLTYKEINDAANRLAASLIDMGIQRQDRVIIFLDNSAESVISLFGIMKAGAIFIMLNATMKAKKLNYILNDSGARVLITHPNKTRVVTEAVNQAPALQNVIWVGKLVQFPAKGLAEVTNLLWNEIFSSSIAPNLSPTASGVLPYALRLTPYASRNIDLDLAAIIYTSGSTAEPKGVMCAHYNVVAAVRSITEYLESAQDDVILNINPLSFDYGLYQVFLAFFAGAALILERDYIYPYRIIEHLQNGAVTGFPIVPTTAAILFQTKKFLDFTSGSVRYVTSTAAPLPQSGIRRLQKCFPCARIYSMYGLTECKRVSYLPPEDLLRKPHSVGIPIPNEEVFIINDEGEKVVSGGVGELVVRGSNVMQGYWNDPEETARVFHQGRYRGETLLYTGDLFRQDDDGYLYFVGRKNDLLKVSGHRVSPKEIEIVLIEMPGVIETAVVGVPDDISGQAVRAFIVLERDTKLDTKDVIKHCTNNMEKHLIPKYVNFMNDLPHLSNGKTDKRRLCALKL